jgi:transcriptional regulator with XRE-family HTH domain
MNVGIKIKKLRESKKLTQPELAHRLGISQTALCEIESGKTKKIDFLLMDKVCTEFEVDFDYFTERKHLKQINKDNAVGYLADNQTFNGLIPEGILEKIIYRLEKLEVVVSNFKNN